MAKWEPRYRLTDNYSISGPLDDSGKGNAALWSEEDGQSESDKHRIDFLYTLFLQKKKYLNKETVEGESDELDANEIAEKHKTIFGRDFPKEDISRYYKQLTEGKYPEEIANIIKKYI